MAWLYLDLTSKPISFLFWEQIQGFTLSLLVLPPIFSVVQQYSNGKQSVFLPFTNEMFPLTDLSMCFSVWYSGWGRYGRITPRAQVLAWCCGNESFCSAAGISTVLSYSRFLTTDPSELISQPLAGIRLLFIPKTGMPFPFLKYYYEQAKFYKCCFLTL